METHFEMPVEEIAPLPIEEVMILLPKKSTAAKQILTAEQLREEEEAREIMEASMIDIDDDDLLIPTTKVKVEEKVAEKVVTNIQNTKSDTMNTQNIKSLTTKAVNMEASIFNELRDIEADLKDINMDDFGDFDFSTVRFSLIYL